MLEKGSNVVQIIVVGAGVVGLSTAFFLNRRGFEVMVMDSDPTGDKASFGNAAGLAVTECVPVGLPGIWAKAPKWLFDPLGPLFVKPGYALSLVPWMVAFLQASRAKHINHISRALHALNERVYEDFSPVFSALDYEKHVHRVGSLTAYNNRESYLANPLEWEIKAARGVNFQEIEAAELKEMEPALGPSKNFAILQPDWAHIDDPKDLMSRFYQYLHAKGVTFLPAKATSFSATDRDVTVHCSDGAHVSADFAVNATGAWSGQLAQSVGDKVLLESERGYNTTISSPGCKLTREVIFAEEKFVATPLSIGLRIGGAAEFSGLEAAPNFERAENLYKVAKRYMPDLADDQGAHWMGHRPATPDSLPVIGFSRFSNRIVHAFGHGHLGLTQGPTTGCLVSALIAGDPPSVDLSPYSIERF